MDKSIERIDSTNPKALSLEPMNSGRLVAGGAGFVELPRAVRRKRLRDVVKPEFVFAILAATSEIPLTDEILAAPTHNP